MFIKQNLDEDYDTIARLLSPYRKAVRESLGQGNYAEAVTVLLEVLESPTYHFVEDYHYNYFDDMYSSDYVYQDMMKAIVEAIKSSGFPNTEMLRLKEGLEKPMLTEAYEDYGMPLALDVWDFLLNCVCVLKYL